MPPSSAELSSQSCAPPFWGRRARPRPTRSANARAQAAQITSELAADQQHLDVVSQQYDAAQQQVQQLSAQVDQIRTTIAQDQTVVGQDQSNLRQDAVTSYMDGSTGGGIQTLFTSNSEQASAADEYRSVVSGDISGAIDSLDLAQSRLTAEQDHLQSAQSQAQTALGQVAAARLEAQSTVANQEATLNGMTAQIATLVAERQAAQAAAAHAAFEARLDASEATPVHHGSSPPGRGPTLADLPSASGAAGAVEAAESQIGVPYVWGGESPGRGFDCSGLTQWAWGRAGVSLPRTGRRSTPPSPTSRFRTSNPATSCSGATAASATSACTWATVTSWTHPRRARTSRSSPSGATGWSARADPEPAPGPGAPVGPPPSRRRRRARPSPDLVGSAAAVIRPAAATG